MIATPNLIQIVLNAILFAYPYLQQLCNRFHCYNNIHVYMIELKNKYMCMYIYILVYFGIIGVGGCFFSPLLMPKYFH